MSAHPPRLLAVAEGLLVSVIWASSFVFVKVALEDIGPLTISGLRYFMAFLLLLPALALRGELRRPLERGLWLRLALIGLSSYTLANGAFFSALQYIPATTGSLALSFTPLAILVIGLFALKETPTRIQIVGLAVALAGGWVFFGVEQTAIPPAGVGLLLVGFAGFVVFGLLSRAVARSNRVGLLAFTAFPLGIGGGFMLLVALAIEGLPAFTARSLAVVLVLAVVNTVLGYLLYNHALRALNAFEMSLLQNLSPLGTALIAWLILDETLTGAQIAGMVIVVIGIVLTQWKRRRPVAAPSLAQASAD